MGAGIRALMQKPQAKHEQRSFRTLQHGEDLLIIRPWSRLQGVVFLVLGVLWNGIGLFSFYPDLLWPTSVLDLLLVIPVGVGIMLLLGGVYHLVNQTVIRVSRSAVHTTHGPLPYPGVCVPLEDLCDVVISTRVTQNDDNTETVWYSVLAVGQRSQTPIIANIQFQSEAQALLSALQKALSLQSS
jgi:hypothetical protein